MAVGTSPLENLGEIEMIDEFDALRDFYNGKRILITGHTGFKGSWLCHMLRNLGAEITGYALKPETSENLFEIAGLLNRMESVFGDIRDIDHLMDTFVRIKPEIVFHLAAQPIVRDSYLKPVYTYETNVMGTVNVLECVRNSRSVRSFLNITTDKVYENKEWEYGYRECDPLDGYDPYSNSKSCSELVTHSYKKSFFKDGDCAISTARAGNVIGGGDFSKDRIIPDCIRAVRSRKEIIVRNPFSTRPYQYVLEPLYAYLLIAMRQFQNLSYEGNYNVGPDDQDCVTTGQLVDMFCQLWGENADWRTQVDDGPHEASYLKLDCSKIKKTIGWTPRMHVEEAVEWTVSWEKKYAAGNDMVAVMDEQIERFLRMENKKHV